MRLFTITFDQMNDTELAEQLTPAIDEAIEEVLKEYDEVYQDGIRNTALHAVTMTMVSLYYYSYNVGGKLKNTILLEDSGYIDRILIIMRNTDKIKWKEVEYNGQKEKQQKSKCSSKSDD